MNLELPLAVICFLAPHTLPSIPGLRPWLIEKMGRAGYLSAYIALSAITFAWLIVAVLRAPYSGLWALSPWQVYATLILVALACVLFIAGLATPNPLFQRIEVRVYIDGEDAHHLAELVGILANET